MFYYYCYGNKKYTRSSRLRDCWYDHNVIEDQPLQNCFPSAFVRKLQYHEPDVQLTGLLKRSRNKM